MVTPEKHLFQTTVQFDQIIVLSRKFAIGSIHDYLLCYCTLVGILFEILRIEKRFSITNIEYLNHKLSSIIVKGKTYNYNISIVLLAFLPELSISEEIMMDPQCRGHSFCSRAFSLKLHPNRILDLTQLWDGMVDLQVSSGLYYS